MNLTICKTFYPSNNWKSLRVKSELYLLQLPIIWRGNKETGILSENQYFLLFTPWLWTTTALSIPLITFLLSCVLLPTFPLLIHPALAQNQRCYNDTRWKYPRGRSINQRLFLFLIICMYIMILAYVQTNKHEIIRVKKITIKVNIDRVQ